MPKKRKIFSFFVFCCLFFVLLAGAFLPSQALANDAQTSKENDPKEYKAVFQSVGSDTTHELKVSYEGLVPCGKCLTVTDGSIAQIIKEPCTSSSFPNTCNLSNQYCKGSNNMVYLDCQLCHIFILINGIINFILIDIVPIVAVLMLVIGGVMYYFGGANPSLLSTANKLFKSVAIGLALIYGAFLIVATFLTVLGAAEMSPIQGFLKGNVFSIKCEIKLSK